MIKDGDRAQCEHGIRYTYSNKSQNWVAENPESNTGEFGCSQCLYLALSMKPYKLLPIKEV